jgi:phage protein D
MPVVTLQDESKQQGDFYVPRYEIKITDANLPLDVLRDVMQVTYNDDIKKLDGFELTVNNWDAFAQEFKYVGSETLESLNEKRRDAKKQPFNPLHRLFDPSCHKVEVFMGYGGDLKLMLSGNFTTMEPNFPSSGGPTLTVRGLNLLHKLRTEPHTDKWSGKKESQIAKSFEKLPDPDNPGKKLLVLIDEDTLRNKEVEIPYVAQTNQYDIDFLLERARRAGYVVFIKEAEKKGDRVIKPRGLYFGPSDTKHPSLQPVTFELKWGISLIDFKPTLTTANQVRSVTVKGWNITTKKPIVGKASIEDQKLNLDLYKLLLQKCNVREEHVVDEPVFTQRQADQRARAILRDRLKDLVKASGTCIGLPDLRAGQRVRISNVGARFSGEYFITDTTHTINDSGYITKFNARREDQGAEKQQ